MFCILHDMLLDYPECHILMDSSHMWPARCDFRKLVDYAQIELDLHCTGTPSRVVANLQTRYLENSRASSGRG